MNLSEINTYWPIIMIFFFAKGKVSIVIKNIKIGNLRK